MLLLRSAVSSVPLCLIKAVFPNASDFRLQSLTAISGIILTVATVVLFLRNRSLPSDPWEEEDLEPWQQAAMLESTGDDQQQTSENALKGGRAKGRGRHKGWTAPRNPRAGKAGPGGDGEEEEEEEEFDMGERDPSLWQRCPADGSGINGSSIPTLEGSA